VDSLCRIILAGIISMVISTATLGRLYVWVWILSAARGCNMSWIAQNLVTVTNPSTSQPFGK
jgi:hypothetical protein